MCKKYKLQPAREADKNSCTYLPGDIYVLFLWLWWRQFVFMSEKGAKNSFLGNIQKSIQGIQNCYYSVIKCLNTLKINDYNKVHGDVESN